MSYERDNAQQNPPNYSTGFWGSLRRRPLSFSTNFNSTLSPSMVNEVRFGLRRTSNSVLEAMDDPDYRDAARNFFPTVNGIPAIVSLSILGSPMLDAAANTQGNKTRTLTFSDTFSWSRGQHAMRLGGEFRASHVDAFSNPNLIPRVAAGQGQVPVLIPSCNNCDFETLLDTNVNYGQGNTRHFQDGNQALLENLLLLNSGSIGNLTQYYFIQDAKKLDLFESYSTSSLHNRIWLQREGALFLQDDWKATRDLTLNLGLRWEYYGVPW
jgi:outer membrane receptor protein involved in Fe transport